MNIKIYAEQIASKIPGSKVKDSQKGLTVLVPEKDGNIYRMHYVEQLYQLGYPVNEAIKEILSSEPTSEKVWKEIKNINSLKNNEHRIILGLLNKERSKDILDTLIYEEFLDLIVVPYILYDFGKVKITKNLLSAWGCTKEYIFNLAKTNMKDLYVYKGMTEMFFGTPVENDVLYVLTNKEQTLGGSLHYLSLDTRNDF